MIKALKTAVLGMAAALALAAPAVAGSTVVTFSVPSNTLTVTGVAPAGIDPADEMTGSVTINTVGIGPSPDGTYFTGQALRDLLSDLSFTTGDKVWTLDDLSLFDGAADLLFDASGDFDGLELVFTDGLGLSASVALYDYGTLLSVSNGGDTASCEDCVTYAAAAPAPPLGQGLPAAILGAMLSLGILGAALQPRGRPGRIALARA